MSVDITLTEGIIVAALGLVGVLTGSWFTARAAAQRVEAERAAKDIDAQAAIRADLMKRIDQLQAHISLLEERITAKDTRIAELEHRVDELEGENARLKTELERICAQRKGQR